jgi:2-polyprenyl-6-methoxyphenol hydroxylase-like FAD-dependent oxidoreductase
MSKSIAILGAGPAGLTSALALARRGGFEITVYEQEEDHMTAPRFNPDRSYTIDITGHGLKALKYCDATDRFDKELLQFKGIKIRALYKTDEWEGQGWTGSRGDICRALQAEIKSKHPRAVKFQFKTQVCVEDVFDGKLSLTPETGSVTKKQFDLVIGSDGAGGASRDALSKLPGFKVTSNQASNYCMMLHFDLPAADTLDARYLEVFCFDPFVVAGAINGPNGPQTARWFCMIGFSSPTTFASVEEAKTYLTKKAGKDIFQYVSDKELSEFIKRPCNNIGRAKTCSSLHAGKVVMVGDSGNPFPPIGQGINCAMEAAMVLDKCIGDCVSKGQRLEYAAAAFTEQWKPEADSINWLARRCDFGDQFKMFLVKIAIAGGFSALSDAKKEDKTYKECADVARGRQEAFGLDPDGQKGNRFVMPVVVLAMGVFVGVLIGKNLRDVRVS